MNTKPIVITKRGAFKADAIQTLQDAGYAVVVASNPDAFRILGGPFLLPPEKISSIAVEVLTDKNINFGQHPKVFQDRVLKATLEAAGLLEQVKLKPPKNV